MSSPIFTFRPQHFSYPAGPFRQVLLSSARGTLQGKWPIPVAARLEARRPSEIISKSRRSGPPENRRKGPWASKSQKSLKNLVPDLVPLAYFGDRSFSEILFRPAVAFPGLVLAVSPGLVLDICSVHVLLGLRLFGLGPVWPSTQPPHERERAINATAARKGMGRAPSSVSLHIGELLFQVSGVMAALWYLRACLPRNINIFPISRHMLCRWVTSATG